MISNNHSLKLSGYWLPIWLLISTFVIAGLLIFFPSSQWLLSLKDVSIFLFLLINIKGIADLKRVPIYVMLLIGILAASAFILSKAPYMAKLASFRQMFMPFILFAVGMQFGRTKAQLEKFKNWMCYAAIVIAVVGAIFYITDFWNYFPLHNYTKAKNLIPDPSGVPYMFYEPLRDGMVPRMVSTILDPINLGHLFCFVLVIAFFEKRINTATTIFIGACFVSTFCKGAFLQLFITLVLLASAKIQWRLQIIVWLVGFKIFLFGLNHHPGVLIHMQGVFLAIKSASMFGYGIGMVGNQASMYGNPLDLGISDTYIGAVLGQVGIVGMIVWLIPFVWMISQLKRHRSLKFLLISQLIVAILSENSFNLMSIFFLMMTIGATINEKLQNEEGIIGHN